MEIRFILKIVNRDLNQILLCFIVKESDALLYFLNNALSVVPADIKVNGLEFFIIEVLYKSMRQLYIRKQIYYIKVLLIRLNFPY